jgi:hypothetical protein
MLKRYHTLYHGIESENRNLPCAACRVVYAETELEAMRLAVLHHIRHTVYLPNGAVWNTQNHITIRLDNATETDSTKNLPPLLPQDNTAEVVHLAKEEV